MSAAGDAVRIGVRVPDDEGGESLERVWASPLGADEYSLDESPFDAYGLSWQDVVRAPPDAAAGMPVLEAVVRKSGHRTVRAVVDAPGEAEARVRRPMRRLGCTFEDVSGRLFAIDVPPEADLDAVARALTDAGVVWEHADPTREDLYGEDEEENGRG